MASQAIVDRLGAQAKMPGAEKVDASGAKTTVDPNATLQQKIEARLEKSEIDLEVMVNSILSINEGPDAPAVGKTADAPTDTSGRLANLEKNLDAVENQMKDIASRYELVYSPFIAPNSSESPTDESRTGVIEQRMTHMNKMLRRLVKNAEADAEGAE
ncbi:type III secretion effector protein [Pseudomonas poae]|uniref:Type III secretion effector protein n=1 Tax=Pseudomonas poae TaxID=200451 RepID=A0A2S9EJ70_9PSED|nr:type III secretion effector protein [Pseudomonas poae]PRC15290.1 type III secretion effector protein [Pseudomonas poae]